MQNHIEMKIQILNIISQQKNNQILIKKNVHYVIKK